MSLNSDTELRLQRIRGRARAASEKPVPARVQAYLNGTQAVASEAEATDAATDAPEGTERRRNGRTAVNANVVVRRIGGFNFEVALHDVSPGGCRVHLVEPSEVGDPVITRFPQLEPLGSRVCWTEGTITGMQFLTSIHPAVFDSLLGRLPAGE